MKTRPKYNMWQNTAFMLQTAWQKQKSVIVLCLLPALLNVSIQLTELLIAPAILQKVETHAPLTRLLTTIFIFTGILLFLKSFQAYIDPNLLFGRINVRIALLMKLAEKKTTTSFPNTEDTERNRIREKAENTLNSNSSAGEAIWNTLTGLLTNVLGFVLYLLLLSSLHPVLLCIVLTTSITGYFVNKKIHEWGYTHREEESEYIKQLNFFYSQAQNRVMAKDIRLFGIRNWLEELYEKNYRLLMNFYMRREKKYMFASVLDVVLSFLRNGLIYIYLIQLVLQNGLSASEFLLYFTAVDGFTSWITGILSNFSTLHKQSLELCTLREYLDIPEPFLFEQGKPLQVDPHETYTLELKNVTFRYPGKETDTFTNFNLKIKAGEKLAIVGLNGAGKTTLVKLLCGFYDPNEGEVLLNSINIKEYNRNDYYKLFSAVFQQFSVLESTLSENVAQTYENIDMERVKEVIAKAGLTKKVESLPKQYETYIGRTVFEDGMELSGGETQRLMLARALYKNAPIIVLDEPTAALDPIAENDIYLKYNEMTKGRTSIYISHRLASTRFCDRILFIENGKIAEEGTHEQLLQNNGSYAELFHIQSKYYQESIEVV